MKSTTRLTLYILLLCVTVCHAFAETQIIEDNTVAYTVYIFGGDFPAEVIDALKALGVAQGEPLCGAMVSSVWMESDNPQGKDDPSYASYAQKEAQRNNYAIALCVFRQDDVDYAVGLRRSAEGVWRITMVSDKAVLPNREYTLSLEQEYDSWRHSLFVFTYPRADGGSDVYALSDRPRGDWRVAWYENRQTDGTGLHITSADLRAFFQLWDLPKTEDYTLRLRNYVYYARPYLSYCTLTFGDIADFPTTEADARRMAQESISALPQDGLLIGGFVNLRTKPSTSSKSLGQYYSGTIGTLLQDSAAERSGWHKVRVGTVEGYVSGIYSVPVPAYTSSQKELVAAYLPPGKLKQDCSLRAAPDSASAELQALAQGAEVQVMGVASNGWLHITLSPWDDIMQRDAVSGYLPADEVDVTE